MDRLELVEDPLNYVLLAGKERIRSPGVQVAEGRLVECRDLHDASGRELVDHHLDEADLSGCETPVIQELGERGLRGGPIHPHEAANEVDQRWRFATGEQSR